MMFQSYALFPHMTVEQNVSFGLKQDKYPESEIKQRVSQMLEMVQLSPFAKRKPHQLSGGQRQRVALARSLVKQPKLLLLDEPLGALDKKLREATQFELMNIQDRLGITFIVVTHDQEEAMTLSTRIGVMNAGQIVQIGSPQEIYEYPQSKMIADFIGSVNLFEGQIVEDEPDHVLIRSDEAGRRHLYRSRHLQRTGRQGLGRDPAGEDPPDQAGPERAPQLRQGRGQGHRLHGQPVDLSGAARQRQADQGHDAEPSARRRGGDRLG